MNAAIEPSVPKYVQVARLLRDRITGGELRPGDEVPSERALAEELNVARFTVNRALAILRAEGLVQAEQGRGTFVRTPPMQVRTSHNRYARARATGKNLTAGQRNQIVSAGRAPAPPEVAASLDLEEGAEVIARRRVVFRIDDPDDPVEMSTSYFRLEVAENTPIAELPNITEGMLAFVERTTGRRYTMAVDRLTARHATEDERELLKLSGDLCVLVNHHITLDEAGIPIEVVESIHPAGRWMFEDEYPIGG